MSACTLVRHLTLSPTAFSWRNCLKKMDGMRLHFTGLKAGCVAGPRGQPGMTGALGAQYRGQSCFISFAMGERVEYSLIKLTDSTKLGKSVDLMWSRNAEGSGYTGLKWQLCEVQ